METFWNRKSALKLMDQLLFFSLCGTFFSLPIATTPSTIFAIISIALWLVSGKFIRSWRSWLKQPWIYPVALFVLLHWAGLLWTNDAELGFSYAKKSYYWIGAMAIATLSAKEFSPKTFVHSFIAGLCVTVTLSFFQYAGFIPMPKGLPTGAMSHIVYSLFLVYGLLLLSYYVSHTSSRKTKICYLLLMLTFFANLMVSTGRSGYVAFIVLCPWIFWNLLPRKSITHATLLTSTAIFILFSSETVRFRIHDAVNEFTYNLKVDTDSTIGSRLHMWNGAIQIFMAHPITGVGTGGYRKKVQAYKPADYFADANHPHNSFLYVASSFGVFGLLALCWLFFIFLRKGWRARDSLQGFAVLSFGFILLIGSLTDTQIMTFGTGMLFALLTGIRTAE